MSSVKFSRVFAMPSAATFSIAPIREFIERYDYSFSVDPFAGESTLATARNDIRFGGVDVVEFLEPFHAGIFKLGFFDPPYSPRQISECYKEIGRKVTQLDTQNAALYHRARVALDRVIRQGGYVLSFGWNSAGMGKGYELEELMLVNHGGAHNDTICLAERKL